MDASTAKVISIIALGLGSFVSGMAPACISHSARQRHPLLISCLLCFGAGVLLSTSLTHMLPEAREKLPEYTELLLCIGFFLVYVVDEIVHIFNGTNEHQFQGHVVQRNYGTVEQTLLDRGSNDDEMRERCCGDMGNPRMCHVSHTEPCHKSSSGVIGLLVALFVHSLLEGLAIGLQETATQVLLLLGAVASHKYVVGFCLGAELCASAPGRLCAHIVCVALFSGGSVAGIAAGAVLDNVNSMKNSVAVPIMQYLDSGGFLPGKELFAHIVCVALFSGGSVAGIAAGAVLDNVNSLKNSVAVPIMQALAAGTLLYVTVSEVLPRERARWHERKHGAGMVQFIAVGVGFAVMYLLTMYLDHDAE